MKSTGGLQFNLGLFPIDGQCLEVFEAVAFFRPAIEHGRCAKKVHREPDHLAIAPLKGTNERRAKDLARQFLTLEIDQIHIAREALGDDLS